MYMYNVYNFKKWIPISYVKYIVVSKNTSLLGKIKILKKLYFGTDIESKVTNKF